MIAHRREDAVEHLLDTLGGALVPNLTEHRLLRVDDQHGRRRNAAECKARAPYPAAVVAIERHRRGHSADVIETSFGDLVETHEGRQRLRNLDAPDDFAALEDGLSVARKERCKRLHARAESSDDLYRRIQREQ